MSTDFRWRHFGEEIFLWVVRWHCCGISYCQRQGILAKRGVDVEHTTLYRWVRRYAPEIEKWLRWARCHPSRSWRVDETVIKAKRRWAYR